MKSNQVRYERRYFESADEAAWVLRSTTIIQLKWNRDPEEADIHVV